MHPQEILLVSRPALEALPQISLPLLTWYDANARSLPWRDDPTPYHVWISEIMLQQTRVEAVKGYYTRFLDALPNIPALATVHDDALLKLWEGLGYYNRARNLKKAAKVILQEFEGALPASYGGLLSLPGIGEYTAGAVASIAFGIPVPAVDGNVLRVISRILGSYADISHPHVKKTHQQLIPAAIPPARPGDFNQSLMELGATVCLPNSAPRCGECPVSGLCVARQTGTQLELPVKAPKKGRRVEERTILVLVAGDRVLLQRRSEDGLLSGMYEPINLMGKLDTKAIRQEIGQLGGNVEKLIPLRTSKHLFTHVEWCMEGFLIYTPPFDPPEGSLWATRQQLGEVYALPSAYRAYTKDLSSWLADGEE